MKKLITLIGILSAIVFLNPAQAKADVRAYIHIDPLAWLFTSPVRVVEKRRVYHRPVYKRPAPKKVVYVKPSKNCNKNKYRSFRNKRGNRYGHTRGDKYSYISDRDRRGYSYKKNRFINKKLRSYRKW